MKVPEQERVSELVLELAESVRGLLEARVGVETAAGLRIEEMVAAEIVVVHAERRGKIVFAGAQREHTSEEPLVDAEAKKLVLRHRVVPKLEPTICTVVIERCRHEGIAPELPHIFELREVLAEIVAVFFGQRIEAPVLVQGVRVDGQIGELRFLISREPDERQRGPLTLPTRVQEERTVLAAGALTIAVRVRVREAPANVEPVIENAGLVTDRGTRRVVGAEHEPGVAAVAASGRGAREVHRAAKGGGAAVVVPTPRWI